MHSRSGRLPPKAVELTCLFCTPFRNPDQPRDNAIFSIYVLYYKVIIIVCDGWKLFENISEIV